LAHHGNQDDQWKARRSIDVFAPKRECVPVLLLAGIKLVDKLIVRSLPQGERNRGMQLMFIEHFHWHHVPFDQQCFSDRAAMNGSIDKDEFDRPHLVSASGKNLVD
jgi:hypothetical protein